MAAGTGPNVTTGDMPPAMEHALDELVTAAKNSFQDDLASIVLFGSGAEGQLRATSDLNLLIVLREFRRSRADAFREPLRMAHVAVRAVAMFVLESEAPTVAEVFAVKFGDIARRCRVLFGQFPSGLSGISREAKRLQLRQLLMNLTLRLRHSYVVISLREEQLALTIAETAGPLRSAAATLLELEGQPVASPKQSLETVARSLEGDWTEALAAISEARQSRRLAPGKAPQIAFQLIDLAQVMRLRAERLA